MNENEYAKWRADLAVQIVAATIKPESVILSRNGVSPAAQKVIDGAIAIVDQIIEKTVR